MLLVQGALISFYTAASAKHSWYALLVATEGFFLAMIWYGILIKGKHYVARWGSVSAAIELADRQSTAPTIQHYLFQLNDAAHLVERESSFPLYRRSSTSLMRLAIASVMIFWLATISTGIVSQVADRQTAEHLTTKQGSQTQTVVDKKASEAKP